MLRGEKYEAFLLNQENNKVLSSPFLPHIMFEVLPRKIRQEKNIKGIPIEKKKLKSILI